MRNDGSPDIVAAVSPRLLPESGTLLARVRAVAHSRRGVARGAWLVARVAVAGFGGILLIFHAWLLWHQLDSGQLLDPLTATKWTAAVALLGGLVTLRVSGVSLLRGRQALIVWTLVALVHSGTASRVVDLVAPTDSPSTNVTLALPAAEALTGLALALVALIRRDTVPTYVRLAFVTAASSPRTLAGCRRDAPCRAPPLTA